MQRDHDGVARNGKLLAVGSISERMEKWGNQVGGSRGGLAAKKLSLVCLPPALSIPSAFGKVLPACKLVS